MHGGASARTGRPRVIGFVAVVIAIVAGVAACADPGSLMSDTSTDGVITTTTTTSATATTGRDVMGFLDYGDVPDDLPLAVVEVSGRTWAVAVADDDAERNRGLRGVADLGELDGMLFVWDRDATSTFGMLGVPITLDIAWFASDGTLVDRTTMSPCDAAPCPSYGASAPYRYAIETVDGGFDGLEPLTLTLDP